MNKHFLSVVWCLFAILSFASAQEKPIVDKYGQYLGENWPGKITSDAQLQADAAKECPLLANVKLDLVRCDQYGGVRAGKPLAATGFFRVQKIHGRWWLITPAGDRFFMQGVDAVHYLESGYFTPLRNPNGTVRGVFQELPDKTISPDAYRGRTVNFLAANLQRKYGNDYVQQWRDVTYKRLLSWGFNSTGQWGWGFTLNLPYVEDMNFANVRRIKRFIDPFDPGFSAQVAKNIQGFRPECKTDPMLIGYACENENGWNRDTVEAILHLGADSPAKQAFIDFLAKRHGNSIAAVAAIFKNSGASRDELLTQPLNIDDVPESDWENFITFASQTYHRIVAQAMKAYDPHHLFLGGAHCGGQSTEWVAGGAKFVDAYVLHDYTLHADWVNSIMATFRRLDKPLLILEYSFVVGSRGLRICNGSNTVATQQQRGQYYRVFNEQLASNPLVVGTSWFVYYDQAATMRSLPNGENFNFGLVNQCDQPYDEMITEMKKSNARLFAIHQGTMKPVSDRDFGIKPLSGPLDDAIPASRDSATIIDFNRPEYFANDMARIKIDEVQRPAPGIHPIGTWYAGAGKGFANAVLTVYLWKNSPQEPETWFGLNESADNVHFTPVALSFTPGVAGEFNQFIVTPKTALLPTTRYLQVTLTVKSSPSSWVNQLGDVNFTTRSLSAHGAK
ncbi:MAG TPA: hypothetical protein VHV83_15830 [Armatimonadota bacterium]|nr:hypothetical protein [Armatimonadota bacterium]